MDAETLKALDALPTIRVGTKAREWTADEDAALMRNWPRAHKGDVARLIGVSEDTARSRYRFLTREGL
jgi:hypothetical protein